MIYQEESNKLIESFLERTFFKGWKNPDLPECLNFRNMEVFLNTKCNQACKYCYLNKYGDKLYPPEFQKDSRQLLRNLKMLLDWLIENRMAPYTFEYFSGEALVQEAAFEGLEIILERFKKADRKPSQIIIPTNFTFLLSEELTKRVEGLLLKSRRHGIPIFLSASFDGKYCEANRPLRSGKELRDDAFYDKCFAFAKKWGSGFHPMIYSELIEQWPKNWLWFQRNFKKHNLPWQNIYLLEVKNNEWTSKQIIKFGEFIEFLIDWSFNVIFRKDKTAFVHFLYRRGFNVLGAPLMVIGRGLGCSIQAAMTVRIGDLAWVPCHRTSYPPFLLAHFKVENNQIVGLESYNPELLIGIYSHNRRNQPWCYRCLLKDLCTGGCLGSQLETHGDLFAPIPTVCELEHVKMAAMVRSYQRLGIFDMILNTINNEKRFALEKIAEFINKPKKVEKVGQLVRR